jgi:hypothetical protein
MGLKVDAGKFSDEICTGKNILTMHKTLKVLKVVLYDYLQRLRMSKP